MSVLGAPDELQFAKPEAAKSPGQGQLALDNFASAATSMVVMEQDEPTDAALVAATLAGNREAFAGLYDRYARLVRAVVFSATVDWSMVQDLTQESFLRAYKNLHRLREPEKFGAWVVGIARQVGKERRRSLRRDRHEFVGDRPLEVESPNDCIDDIRSSDEFNFILKRLAELPERERLAIHTFFLQGCDADKAAAILELSRSGFYALLARAVSKLAAHIGCREPETEAK
jgi:RNA polymerase sigma factor (sigma-70 family)